ncbi:MAG: hypothetical protein Q7T61_21015 [Caulobacter sp.]|nr:hypothetical protein [Caulobacter sp.]
MRRLWSAAPVVAALSLLLLAPPAPAAEKCTVIGSVAKPAADGAVKQLPGGFRFYLGRYRKDCRGAGSEFGYGLLSAEGKVLVPAKYPGGAVPISSRAAIVQPVRDGPLKLFLFGKGERQGLPYEEIYDYQSFHDNLRLPIAQSAKGADGRRDYFLFRDDSETPVTLKGLTAIGRFGSVLLASLTIDGQPVSRVLDLRGEPLSPIVGRIETWHTVPANDSYRQINWVKLPHDLIATVGAFRHPDLPYGKLYLPLDEAGRPLPLPAGAIGVMPLSEHADPTMAEPLAFGWAVIYAAPDGFRIAPGLTGLRAALAAPPTLSGLVRQTAGMTSSNAFIQDVYAARTIADGRWRIVDRMTLKPVALPGNPAGFATTDAAYGAYLTDKRGFQQSIIRQQVAARAAQDAADARWRDSEWARIRGQGSVCKEAPRVLALGREALTALLSQCPVIDPRALQVAARLGVDPGVIAKGRASYDAQQARNAELLRPPPPPARGADPWAAGLAAAQAAADDSFNSFAQRQTSVYMQNLNAWNSGAQNWCCSGTAPK